MNSYYYIILTLEIEFQKSDLSIGYMDNDKSKRNYVLKQLREDYPSEKYNWREYYDGYVISLKNNLPAKPLMILRDCTYALMKIDLNGEDMFYEEPLKQALVNADIAKMVEVCQDNDGDYSKFYWRTYKSYLDLDTDETGVFSGRLPIIGHGIQIYQSDDYFETEMGGSLHLLESPLRKILNKAPYIDLLSIRIGDADRY